MMSEPYHEFGLAQQPQKKISIHWIAQEIPDVVSTILGIVIVIIVAIVSYNLGAIKGQPIIRVIGGSSQVCQYDQALRK
ncbi:MAG: hypothetical protein HYT07_00350 [Candidatus Levybacteria bacterium]|nr:hypothetical protein [Candidatus Levybacteria bacterium]